MSQPILPADQCRTMTDVRQAIDAIDRDIVEMLARRMRYIEAAARIKPTREAVRDEERKTAVITQARESAESFGFPPDLAEAVYEVLVEGSIAHEFERFDGR